MKCNQINIKRNKILFFARQEKRYKIVKENMEYTNLIPPKNLLLVEILSYYKENGDTVSEVKKVCRHFIAKTECLITLKTLN